MDISELITKQRNAYVSRLLNFYETMDSGAREILLEIGPPEREEAFRLFRPDHLREESGKYLTTELNSDTYIKHEPVSYGYKNTEITIHPFFWNGCEFEFEEEPKDYKWLEKWTMAWIDPEDKNGEDENGLSKAIHNVTKPERRNGAYMFSVDFGSAEIDAFMDLVIVLAGEGIKRVRIGSFSMLSKEVSEPALGKLTGTWEGEFEYLIKGKVDAGRKVRFVLELKEENEEISGICLDDETRELFPEGATVLGFRIGSSISFVKRYPRLYMINPDGRAAVDRTKEHPGVEYTGSFDSQRNCFVGEWRMVERDGNSTLIRGKWSMRSI